jgi:hypothetical protein
MLSQRTINLIFTDRKARRVRTTAPFRSEVLAWIEGWRRRSRRVAIDVTSDPHEAEALKVVE